MSAVREPELLVNNPPVADLSAADPGGLVIGGDYQGLGITRSLGRRGIPVSILDDEFSIARFSRYVRDFVRVRDLRDEERTIESLMSTGRRLNLKGWVLYPTRDETVAALSRHRKELSEIFRVPTPEWSAIRWAWDKRNTYEMAVKLGIPTPGTRFPRTVEEARNLEVNFPVVIKPAIKEHFVYATKVKAWRADNRQELADRFEEAARFVPEGEIMIQDLIPGGGEEQFACCAFFKNGRAIGTMTTQRARQHPPEFGRSSTFVRSVDLPVLEERAQRFLGAIDYYGLAEVEFKRDPRNGEYKLLDVNARTWGYHSLGAAAGVDFPHMLFQDQLGKSVTPARAVAGKTWIRWVTDLPAGVHGVFRKEWSASQYLRTLRQADTESVFDIRDPLPSIAEAALVPYLAVVRGY